MKKILTISFLLLFFQNTKAQVVFCPAGATWHYNFDYYIVNHQLQQYVQILVNVPVKYERDSLLGTKLVKVLSHEYFFEGTCDTYNSATITLIDQRGDTIFFRNKNTKHKWQILYNFAALTGQQWVDSLYNSANQLVLYIIKVDSIGLVNINGFDLKRLYVKYNSSPAIITERFGTNFFLFHFFRSSCDAPADFERFLCYQDSIFNTKQFTSRPCNFSTALYAGVEGNMGEDYVNVYPNPLRNKLNLSFKNNSKVQNSYFQITNLFGQVLLSSKITSIETQVDLSALQNGIYFLEIMDNTNTLINRKIIKE